MAVPLAWPISVLPAGSYQWWLCDRGHVRPDYRTSSPQEAAARSRRTWPMACCVCRHVRYRCAWKPPDTGRSPQRAGDPPCFDREAPAKLPAADGPPGEVREETADQVVPGVFSRAKTRDRVDGTPPAATKSIDLRRAAWSAEATRS